MKKGLIPVAIFSTVVFFSCERSSNSESPMSADASNTTEDAKLLLDSTRQYKQSAYIKMLVPDVANTKNNIRKIIKQQNGFILSSVLNNSVENTKIIPLNTDSSKEIKQISISNSFSLKVPVQHLDSTITLLEAQGLHVDESSQEAEDISPMWLTSKENNQTDSETIAQLKTSNNISNIQMQYGIKKDRNEALNNSREMQYQIKYCDLKVDIYQSTTLQSSIVANLDRFNKERIPFGYSMKQAFASGYYLFLDIIIGLSHLWMIILAGVIIFFIWKKYRSKKRIAHA